MLYYDVDPLAEELRQLAGELPECIEPDPGRRLEFDQDIDVAVRPVIASSDAAKDGKLAHLMATAKGREVAGRTSQADHGDGLPSDCAANAPPTERRIVPS
jgi:hypothetical protein